MTSASIPSRRTLNVQLGPTAADASDDDPYEAAAAAANDELRTAPRRTPRQQPPTSSRIRWSRMAAPPGQPPAAPPPPLEPPPSMALLAAGSSGAASLCQLIDFGETRDLIRRQRETAKQLEEVSSIVSHLSLDKENGQGARRHTTCWETFRQQPNSQFKQYVFQSPGRVPALPTTDSDEAAALWQNQHQHHLQHHQHHQHQYHHHQQQHQQPALQRSRTTPGLSGRPMARHSRPEPLGAAALRRSSEQGSLSREVSRTSMVSGCPAGSRPQGYSSVVAHDATDSPYRQFAHRKSKSFRLA